MEPCLTKDAEKLLAVLYKEYTSKLKKGAEKSKAIMLGGSDQITEKLLPTSSKDYVAETCRELGSAGMLKIFYADDKPYLCQLLPAGISYVETKFERSFTKLLDYIGKIPYIG